MYMILLCWPYAIWQWTPTRSIDEALALECLSYGNCFEAWIRHDANKTSHTEESCVELQKISISMEVMRTPSSSHFLSFAAGSFPMNWRGTSNGGGLCMKQIITSGYCNNIQLLNNLREVFLCGIKFFRRGGYHIQSLTHHMIKLLLNTSWTRPKSFAMMMMLFLITKFKRNHKDTTMLRIKGQLIPRKKGCCLISLLPVAEPRRLPGSLCSSALINCLAARLACKICQIVSVDSNDQDNICENGNNIHTRFIYQIIY